MTRIEWLTFRKQLIKINLNSSYGLNPIAEIDRTEKLCRELKEINDELRGADMNKELAEFLKGVEWVVEATGFEMDRLWHMYAERQDVTWEQNLSGMGKTVGMVADMPVFISLRTARINGRKVLFVEPTSQVVDWRMIHGWLKEQLPEAGRTDANNFYLALGA